MKDNLNDDSQNNDLNIPSLNGAVHSILKENKLIHSSNHTSLKNVHLNHLSLKDLKSAIVNFCSITNKRPHLEAFLVSNNVDILIGTESHHIQVQRSFLQIIILTEKTESVMVVVCLLQLKAQYLPIKLTLTLVLLRLSGLIST